jgi:hypothetical protein
MKPLFQKAAAAQGTSILNQLKKGQGETNERLEALVDQLVQLNANLARLSRLAR